MLADSPCCLGSAPLLGSEVDFLLIFPGWIFRPTARLPARLSEQLVCLAGCSGSAVLGLRRRDSPLMVTRPDRKSRNGCWETSQHVWGFLARSQGYPGISVCGGLSTLSCDFHLVI